MKKIAAVIMALSACAVCAFSVSAENADKVVDNADLLTDSQEQELEDKLSALVDKYDCDAVIVTTDTIDGKTPMAYADDYFDYNDYGVGTDRDGVLFLLSMEDRDWWISTRGEGIDIFTDYGIQFIGDEMLSDLSGGDYYEAFCTFAELSDDFMEQAQDGEPYDVDNKYKTTGDRIKVVLISMGIGIVAALIVTFSLKGQLKSVKPNNQAKDYVRPGSMKLTSSRDVFLYKNVDRTVKQTSSSSGGGGSSTHTSSSGATHGGGGGKF